VVASKPVGDAFWQYFWVTLELNLFASPLIIFLGIWLGTVTGIHHDTPVDHTARILAVIGWSLPTFLFALILMMIFYGYFGIFPPGTLDDQLRIYMAEHPETFHHYTRLLTIDGLLNGRPEITLDAFQRLVLPVLTEVVVIVALLVRVMRSSMIEELSKDYVVTALAKGAPAKTVYFRHARKNALIPVVTVSGWVVAFMMEGSISVEIVFNRKGLGWWLAHSATQLDMPVLMAMCLFMGVVYVFTNLIIDILYAYIDPRIRLA
jgi:peptide/nickel transport system permease protein